MKATQTQLHRLYCRYINCDADWSYEGLHTIDDIIMLLSCLTGDCKGTLTGGEVDYYLEPVNMEDYI